MINKKIVLIAHYYAPLNVTGAKRPEALSRYVAQEGGKLTVLTTNKKIKRVNNELNESIKGYKTDFDRYLKGPKQ